MKLINIKGFTLIELLVVISIIALLSSVVFATLSKARIRARDSARIQNARQIALALEQYEHSANSYKVAGSGYNNEGSGYLAKGAESPGYTNSILSSLKSAGYVSNANLKDPVYGTDNYYLGLCTETNAYNIFVKLEQKDLLTSTSTLTAACGGPEAVALGFNSIASTVGGSSGGPGFTGATEFWGGTFASALGIIDSSFNVGSGANNTVTGSMEQPDGKTIIVGMFTTYNGVTKNRIARLNLDGSIDNTFNMGLGANDIVYDITAQSDGKIIIGGNFTSYNGVSRGRVARLNQDGSLDTSFNPSTGAESGTLFSVLSQPDGKVVLGGTFATVNGASRNKVARLNSDGSLDTSFNPGTGANGNIITSTIQSSGKIIIAGEFTSYDGTTKNYIARLNTNGSLDGTFNMGTGADTSIYNSLTQPDDKIVIGGWISSYNGTSRNRIARLNADGSLDTSFNPGSGANAATYDCSMQSDGKIMIVGGFTTFNGVSRNSIARLNTDGSLDTSFNPGTGADPGVYIHSVRVQPDGKIVIGGDHTSFNGVSINRVTRLQ